MGNQVGKTIEQINKENLKRIAENTAKRQQESAERFSKLSNGLGTAFSKQHNLAEVTETAQGILNGSVNPKELGVDWCVDFTAKCNSAIKGLNTKSLEVRTSAGLAYIQNRLESYKKLQQEQESIDATITMLKTFV